MTSKNYRRIWIWKRRQGLPTRKPFISETLTPAQLRERKILQKQKAYLKKKFYVDINIGRTCVICGLPAKNIHKKDGNKHDFFYKTPWRTLDRSLKTKHRFAPLCQACHKDVHYVMDNNHVGWTGAYNILKKRI